MVFPTLSANIFEENSYLEDYLEKRSVFEAFYGKPSGNRVRLNESTLYYEALILQGPVNDDGIGHFVWLPELYLPEEMLYQLSCGNTFGVFRVVGYGLNIDNLKQDADLSEPNTFIFRLEDILSKLFLSKDTLRHILTPLYNVYFMNSINTPNGDRPLNAKIDESLKRIMELSRVDGKSSAYKD